MKRVTIFILCCVFAIPAFAKTHKDNFSVPCKTLWEAVRDTLRNSGKYGIIGINSEEMTASYIMGGNLNAKRINSVVLNSKGENTCELQIQTAFSGLVNNDYGDFKDRVSKSLEKIQAAAPAPAKTPAAESKPASPAEPPAKVPAESAFPEKQPK